MSRVPRIRFKGFEEDWEQRKTSELFKITRGYVLAANITAADKSGDNPYPVYSSQTKDNGLMGYYKDYLYENAITWTTDGANAGTVNYRGEKFYCTNVCGVLLGDKVTPNQMLAEAINNVAKGHVSYVGNPKLMNNVMAEICIWLPSEDTERKAISTFVYSLDRLITLHQRKLEKLKIIKKSMLENLFPQNGEKTPKNRFSGFTKDWEQRKLGDMAERIIRKNEKLESTLPLTISAQYGLIDQNEFFDKRIASKDVRGYYLIKKGEFAYNKSTSVDAPLGAIKRLDKYKNGVLSTLYILFKIIDDTSTSSDYLVTYYVTDLWHRGIQSIAAEGARNHGLLNIAPNDFFETMLSIPLNISEQKKVGDFFISLDHLITLHQLEPYKLIFKAIAYRIIDYAKSKPPRCIK